jgi:hypothetical protein
MGDKLNIGRITLGREERILAAKVVISGLSRQDFTLGGVACADYSP